MDRSKLTSLHITIVSLIFCTDINQCQNSRSYLYSLHMCQLAIIWIDRYIAITADMRSIISTLGHPSHRYQYSKQNFMCICIIFSQTSETVNFSPTYSMHSTMNHFGITHKGRLPMGIGWCYVIPRWRGPQLPPPHCYNVRRVRTYPSSKNLCGYVSVDILQKSTVTGMI